MEWLLCYFEYEYFGHVICCFYYVNLDMSILMVILVVFQFFHEVIRGVQLTGPAWPAGLTVFAIGAKGVDPG